MEQSNSQIVKLVANGGPRACLVLTELLENGDVYPGPVSDIKSLTSDYSNAVFTYPVASFAWAYLEAHGIAHYDGDDPLIKKLVSATVDGSFCGRAYS